MNGIQRVTMLLVCWCYTTSAMAEGSKLDPFSRDEDLSGTEISVTVTERPDGFYDYVYRVGSPPQNKGTIASFLIDLTCDLDFGPVVFPEPPDPLLRDRGGLPSGPHVPVQIYHDPVHTTYMTINARGQADWLIALRPSQTGEHYRLLSPAPPALRQYELVPGWATHEYDYSDIDDEQAEHVPWIHTFTVTGMIEGPSCSTETSPEPVLFLGSGRPDDPTNALLAYSEPLRDRLHVPADTMQFSLTVVYSQDIDPATFRVQPGWARRYFNPVPGTAETVTLPLRDAVNRFHLEVTTARSPGPRKDDDAHHSFRDRDTFEVRREMPESPRGRGSRP